MDRPTNASIIPSYTLLNPTDYLDRLTQKDRADVDAILSKAIIDAVPVAFRSKWLFVPIRDGRMQKDELIQTIRVYIQGAEAGNPGHPKGQIEVTNFHTIRYVYVGPDEHRVTYSGSAMVPQTGGSTAVWKVEAPLPGKPTISANVNIDISFGERLNRSNMTIEERFCILEHRIRDLTALAHGGDASTSMVPFSIT